MFSIYKKNLVFVICIFVTILISNGLAFSELITIDGRDDAGINPEQMAFAKFKLNDNGSYVVVDPTDSQPWSNSQDVYNYAQNLSNWRLQSAGNIWSSDKRVGDSLSISSAGTYRISPVSGAYMYDAPGWWPGFYANKYWWKIYIKATKVYLNGQVEAEHGYILGPNGIENLDLNTLDTSNAAYDLYNAGSGNYNFNDYFSNPDAAFNAVKDRYIDIPLAAGGELSFWIWDWNSIDNSGSLTFNVASVPEPSTFLLLTIGIAFLVRRIRS